MRSLPLVGRVARLLADRRDETRPAVTAKGAAYAGLMAALDEPKASDYCERCEQVLDPGDRDLCSTCLVDTADDAPGTPERWER